jgi:enoyl-CoA hydratase/carnithine racemase
MNRSEEHMKFLITKLAANGVVHVSLKRAPVNAVHYDMYCEIADLFRDVDQLGDNVRAVVLSGDGKHFCGGNDLDEFATMTPDNASERMWRVRRAFFAISECAVPVIGAVHGVALGTGLAIAASCDFVVAAPDAKFGLPELTVGVMGGARHLARIAPQPLVRRMYFTGEPMSAADFAAAGGAVMVVDGDRLLDEAFRLAGRVASFSPTAARVSKRILDRIEWMELREGYEFEQGGTERMSGHPDSKEALAAFREKRAPVYQPLDRSTQWYGI